jgi:molybdate/tungstate transport system substrate-binding protein
LHQLSFARISALTAALTLACALPSAAIAGGPVDVLYAGSLVTPMEGPVKAALHAVGIDFEGEPGGSKKLAGFIVAGVRSPDVFIGVDPAIVAGLGARVAQTTTFAGTSLGIAWAPQSKYAATLQAAAAGKISLQHALASPGIRIARTDPQLDPKGAYTVAAVRLWLGNAGSHRLLGGDENSAQIFPEEDLLARIETGQADAAFLYRTEAVARGYRFVPLPGKAALADRITYTLAIMKDAPHPARARAFAEFLLSGPGRALLERAGLTYLRAVSRPDSR